MINPYLWAFLMSAAASVPVRTEVRVRFDGKIRFDVFVHMLGMCLSFRGQGSGRKKRNGTQRSHLVGKFREIKNILKSFHFRMAEVHAHISCEDAAAAAIGYAAVSTLLCTAQACLPFAVKASVDMDFRAEGSFASFVCITDTRVGNLCAAILRLWMVMLSQLKAEEEKYAASH